MSKFWWWLCVVSSFCGALLAAFGAILTPVIPTFESVRTRFRPSDIEVLDSESRFLQRVRVEAHYRAGPWLAFTEFPEALTRTVIAAEDKRFFSHNGVDFFALGRALIARLTGKSRSGASTLTMQTVTLISSNQKASFPSHPYLKKFGQMLGAWQLEWRWSKEQILEAYLNLVPFKGEVRGFPAASRELIGVSVSQLPRDQTVLLTALIPSPNISNERLLTRACQLALRLNSEWNESHCAAMRLPSRKSHSRALPESTLSVTAARSILSLTKLKDSPASSLVITLDRELQHATLGFLRAHIAPLKERNAHDAAALVVHNATGEVRAYVPNLGAHSSRQFVDGILAARQAGSTLKPFIYARAIERKLLTPQSLLLDAPLEIAVFGGAYRPANYDNTFHGVVPAYQALASSLNIPALRVLRMVGIEDASLLLDELGLVKRSSSERYGYSIALGAPSVRLWDLVNAYRALANRGMHSPLHASTPYAPVQPKQIFSTATARAISDILSDRESRQMTFGLENALATPFWSAVKTGTSKDMTDNWCIGFSETYTVGVWVGNFPGDPMQNVSGVSGAAPVWTHVMRWLRDHRAEKLPSQPAQTTSLIRAALAPLSARAPRITYPMHGASIARDPGIPAHAQALMFSARYAAQGTRWQLNESVLGQASAPFLWRPEPGTHVLRLVDHNGATLDSVTFSVR